MSLTRSLTRPLTRKISRADLTQGFGGSFSPFALDPYLLFDARDSMVGTLENPTLDLNPALPETLDVITATRAGIATYTDSSGLIKAAPANTVRVDHVDSVPMILVEPSATNLIGNSDFSSGWSLSSGATVEQTTESTPMASQTALRLTSTQISSRYQTPSGYTSGTSTASVYIKWDGVDTRFRIERAIPSSRAEFNVTQGGVTHHLNNSDGYSIEEHGDGWWRVSNTMANPTWVQFHADSEDGDGSILVALPQHEAGSIPTSYIPTSGSTVTRAADDLVISGSDFTNFFNSGGDGTFYAEFTTRTITDDTIYVLAGSSSTQRYMYSNSGQLNLSGYDGSGGSLYSGPIQETLNRASISYDSNTKTGSLNGSADSTVAGTGALRDSSRLSIGQSWSSASQLNGHIKRLIYWPYHSDSL